MHTFNNRETQKRLLVVEDNFSTCNLIAFFLEKLNFGYSIAMTGEEAIELIEDNVFDGFLIDIFLGIGKITGIAVMEKIRSIPIYKEKPILVVTAYENLVEKKIGVDLFNNYLIKPIVLDVLIEKLTEIGLINA